MVDNFPPWSSFSTDPISQNYHNCIATSSWVLFFSATSSELNSQNPLCYVHLIESPSFPTYFISKKDVLFSFFSKQLLYRTDSHMDAFPSIIILTFSSLELGLSILTSYFCLLHSVVFWLLLAVSLLDYILLKLPHSLHALLMVFSFDFRNEVCLVNILSLFLFTT